MCICINISKYEFCIKLQKKKTNWCPFQGYTMGNCLKINSADDISLLRGSESNNGQDSGPLPIYQAST